MGRVLRWTAALVVLGVVGLGWSLMTGDDSRSPHSVPERPLAPGPGTPTVVPTGPQTAAPPADLPPAQGGLQFERSEPGARAAAVAYLELTEEAVALGPGEAVEMQRAIATAEFADEFGADTEQRMVELNETIPGGIVLRVAPIEVRSDADDEDWLVSVWYAQAITMVGEAVVDDWRTASYRMRWESGTWKIAAFSSERGPTPGRGNQPASASPIDFEAQLDGYSDEGIG